MKTGVFFGAAWTNYEVAQRLDEASTQFRAATLSIAEDKGHF